jgi:predicted Zn finger-like uncharacterized protein
MCDSGDRGRLTAKTAPKSGGLGQLAQSPVNCLCVRYGFRFVNGRPVICGQRHLANSSMHIVCPHCTTSYAVDPATFGEAGRTVRCSRCKETWLAHPEQLPSAELRVPAMAASAAAGGDPDDAGWGLTADDEEGQDHGTPMVDSPSISSDWPEDEPAADDWPSLAQDDKDLEAGTAPSLRRATWLGRLLRPSIAFRLWSGPPVSLSTTCAAMAALVLALMVWRVDVVRLMPQTASFYKMVGLEVNLRGLAFKDVKLGTEDVDGKSVLVVEGLIVDETRKPVELPRLRFIVRDAQGTEIYAWNAVLEQPLLKPGEKAWFRTRLASPPPEGRSIDVRFFNRRDTAAGST